MDFTSTILQLFYKLWWLIPIVIVLEIIKSPWFKGVTGESLANLNIKLFLDENKYHLLKNVTLSTEDGTTQIDHIIVSEYGVFVVETKNMKGWIFGSSNQKYWTQQIYRYKNKFQNPLHQNYKHTKTIEHLLGLHSDQIFSVVVFIGESTFKTKMPENVTSGRGLIRFIKSKQKRVFSDVEVADIKHKIGVGKIAPSLKTSRRHIKHVKTIVAQKEKQKKCPKCGSEMVIREAKKGVNTGKKFWGCSTFPKCRGIVDY